MGRPCGDQTLLELPFLPDASPSESAPRIPHTPQQKVPGSAPGSLAVDLMRCEKEEEKSTLWPELTSSFLRTGPCSRHARLWVLRASQSPGPAWLLQLREKSPGRLGCGASSCSRGCWNSFQSGWLCTSEPLLLRSQSSGIKASAEPHAL